MPQLGIATFEPLTPEAPPPLAIAHFEPVTSPPVVPGNIDLASRPVVHNPDGSISTVLSKSFELDGKEVLLPTIVGGQHVSDQEAIAHFKQTGEHLGMFADAASADAYAAQLHDDYAAGKYAAPATLISPAGADRGNAPGSLAPPAPPPAPAPSHIPFEPGMQAARAGETFAKEIPQIAEHAAQLANVIDQPRLPPPSTSPPPGARAAALTGQAPPPATPVQDAQARGFEAGVVQAAGQFIQGQFDPVNLGLWALGFGTAKLAGTIAIELGEATGIAQRIVTAARAGVDYAAEMDALKVTAAKIRALRTLQAGVRTVQAGAGVGLGAKGVVEAGDPQKALAERLGGAAQAAFGTAMALSGVGGILQDLPSIRALFKGMPETAAPPKAAAPAQLPAPPVEPPPGPTAVETPPPPPSPLPGAPAEPGRAVTPIPPPALEIGSTPVENPAAPASITEPVAPNVPPLAIAKVEPADSGSNAAASGQGAVGRPNDVGDAENHVESGMPAGRLNREVVLPVIRSIPISVVNNLGGEQRATDLLLHDDAVLTDSLSVPRRADVLSVITAAREVVAAERTKLSNAGAGTPDAEYLVALEAFDRNLGERAALLAPDKNLPAVTPGSAAADATPGAILETPGLAGADLSREGDPTKPADSIDSHSQIVPPSTNDTLDDGPNDLHLRRELGRMATELENWQFTKRGFVEAGPGRGGDLEVVPGAGGAPVYDDILQASPGTAGYSRAAMASALRKYLKTGKVTNVVKGALDVARARSAGKYSVSKPSWGIESGDEPGQIYVKRAKELPHALRAVQRVAADLVEAHPAEMIAKYRAAFPDTISADSAKELFPGYGTPEERTANETAIHPAAIALAQAVFDQVIAEPTPEEALPDVVWSGGGTGSGKTTGLEKILAVMGRVHAVYDSTLSDETWAMRNIESAFRHDGKGATIVFTYRPIEAAFRGTLTRAMKTGRPVPIAAHLATHAGALKTIRAIKARYGKAVDVIVFDNSGAEGAARRIELQDLPDPDYTDPSVREALHAIVDEELAAGTISEAVARGARGRAQGRGSDSRRVPPQDSQQVDTLDTGEAQPRLPDAGAVRDTETKTPEFEAPFSLTGEPETTNPVEPGLNFTAPPKTGPKGTSGAASGGGTGPQQTPTTATLPEPRGSSGLPFDPDVKVKSGGETIRPIQFPELVDLARDLQQVPGIKKAFRLMGGGALGVFRHSKGIELRADLFKQGGEFELAKVLAHEIGHLVDYLPHATLTRGNILGRLRSLRRFMKHTFTSRDGFTIRAGEVREELKAVTLDWTPWDRAHAEPSYIKYRDSSKELYAEALSVLLVDPGRLERLAPIFFREFFNELDSKPDVKQAYFDLQELLAGTKADLLARRRTGVRRMLEEGDVKAIELERRRQAEEVARRKDLWLRMKIQLVDKNYAVIDRVNALKARQVRIADDENPVYLLEERNYIGGRLKGFTERHFAPIFTRLDDADIHWNAFGEALFYERIIAGDRSEVANPRGLSPETATELYTALRTELGGEKVAVLQPAMQAFRGVMKQVAQEAFDAGLYTPELYDQMQQNPAYVTFQVIEHLESAVTSRVYRQIGTLKDIVNPADASILKTLVTIRAIEHNKVKAGALTFLARHFPGDIADAKTQWSGKGPQPIKSKDKNQKLITYYSKGKLVGKYVDTYIANSLENESVGQNFAVVSVLRGLNSGYFRPVFTAFNLGFQSFNFARDFQRFWKNVPGMTITKALQRYWKAVPVARIRAFGLPETPTPAQLKAYEDLLEAENAKILSVTFNDLINGREIADTQIEDILRRTGVGGFQPHRRARWIRPAVWLLDTIKELGDFVETLPKVAGIYEYKGAGAISQMPASTRSFIRRKVGSPDFLAGGTWKPVTNEVLLFSNAMVQGVRADVEVAFDPTTRAGWWWKTVARTLLPKVLMYGALIGLFGETLRRLLSRTTEYDRTNYTVVPLGEDSDGNTVYVRLPEDQTGQMVGGVFWKMLHFAKGDRSFLSAFTQVADYMGGQVPGVMPAFSAIGATYQFIAGQNPYDAFRGRNVFTDDEWKARDWHTTKKFVGWEFQQLGGGIVWKFYAGDPRPKTETTGQHILDLPIISNFAGRFLRITNYGEVEQLTEVKRQVEQGEARHRLNEGTAVNQGIRRLMSVSKAEQPGRSWALAREISEKVYADADPQERAQRTAQIVKKLSIGLVRGKADPLTDTVMSAGSNDQRVALITTARTTMGDTAWRAWLAAALQEGAISADVYNAALRTRKTLATVGP